MEQGIDTSKLCIAVVDMQDYYLETLTKNEKDLLVRSHLCFLEKCVQLDLPIVAFECQDPYSPNYRETNKEIKEKISQAKRKRFFEKEHCDGFTYYPLVGEQLNEWKINTLCFTGINASACVLETAEGALNQGYNILTAEDLLADRTGKMGGVMHAKNCFLKNGRFFESYKDILKNLK